MREKELTNLDTSINNLETVYFAVSTSSPYILYPTQ
jgi:hypothetical protein